MKKENSKKFKKKLTEKLKKSVKKLFFKLKEKFTKIKKKLYDYEENSQNRKKYQIKS